MMRTRRRPVTDPRPHRAGRVSTTLLGGQLSAKVADSAMLVNFSTVSWVASAWVLTTRTTR